MKVEAVKALKGEVVIPGDKSISHRAVMFGSLALGDTEITGFLNGADCLSTIACFRSLGVGVTTENDKVIVHGKGLEGLSCPPGPLDVGNSGTTMRLLSGILAGQRFDSVLDGDSSIRRRPMGRVINPLTEMGALIEGKDNKAPLHIKGRPLKGIDYHSPVASAQVKSCVLLAGLYADGETKVTEPVLSRDHTERMLRAFGADLQSKGTTTVIKPHPILKAQKVSVPGDISSAAYFIAAALLVKGSSLLVKNVGINPTRDGFLRVVKAMGGNIEYLNEREESGEPVADILVKYSELHGTEIKGEIIPTLIDEIPVIACMAAAAEGTTGIRDASELRVKETDRVETVVNNLKAVGVSAEPLDDGMIIHGGNIAGGEIDSFGDHRIAMSFAIAGLISSQGINIKGAEAVSVSYPTFFEDLYSLCGK